MNYRPVSILIALSKVYEKAMSLQISDYFSNIFPALLSAFRKGYSCQSTLLNMIENFKCALDRGEYIACISMDISKAFDCLPHCLTICKLRAYGLSRNACTLVVCYLYKRQQRVKVGSFKSDWKEISKGVPQGPILGPLIFNIFMNDIFYFVKNANLFNYADDNSLSVNGKELTHWGRVTHICVVKLTIIGSDDGLSPGRRQAIIWTNAGILLIGPLGTNFIEILIGIQKFSFKKMHLKVSSAKWRPFWVLSMLSRLL